MPPRAYKKTSFKRKPFGRRPSFKKKYLSRKRKVYRRSTKGRRLFPKKAKKTKRAEYLSMTRIRQQVAMADRCMTKNTSIYQYPHSIVYGSFSPSALSDVNPNDYIYVDMNNIYTPGTQNVIASTAFPIADGYTYMNDLYAAWKVQSCAIEVKITVDQTADGTGAEALDLYASIVPMGHYMNTAMGTIPMTQWELQPYYKKYHLGAKQSSSKTMKHFMSIVKIQGVDPTHMKDFTTFTIGSGTTPPLAKPTWWIMLSAPNSTTFAGTVRYTFECKVTYYTMWEQRRPIQFAMSEEDKILQAKLLADFKESKEEKKEDPDYFDEPDFTSLSISQPATPPGTPLKGPSVLQRSTTLGRIVAPSKK